ILPFNFSGPTAFSLLQCVDVMADWKQITARIRRARGSRDPAGQLTLLFEKTKDAMVAFELGRHFEVVRDPALALQWYQTAASRFRRGEWKTKANEAIGRLGGEIPADAILAAAPANDSAHHSSAHNLEQQPVPVPALTIPEPGLPFEQNAAVFESLVAVGSEVASLASPENPAESAEKKRRRRGRRGGRSRNKKALPTPTAESSTRSHRAPEPHSTREAAPAAAEAEIVPPRSVDARAIPRLPVEPLPDSAS